MSEKTNETTARLSASLQKYAADWIKISFTPFDRKNWEIRDYIWHVEKLEKEIRSERLRDDEQKKQIWSLTCSRNYWRARANKNGWLEKEILSKQKNFKKYKSSGADWSAKAKRKSK